MIKIISVMIGIILSTLSLYLQYNQIQKLKAKNIFYENQIQILINTNKIEQERYANAKKTADKEIKQLHEQVENIFKQPVSEDCGKAIIWAIGQSKQR